MEKAEIKDRPEGCLTPQEVADLHSTAEHIVSLASVYKALSRKQIAATKVGRRSWITEADARAWVPNRHIGRPSTGEPIREHRLQMQLGDDEEGLLQQARDQFFPKHRRATAARELMLEGAKARLGI